MVTDILLAVGWLTVGLFAGSMFTFLWIIGA